MKVHFEPGIPVVEAMRELQEGEGVLFTYEQCQEVEKLLEATRPARRLVRAAEEVLAWAQGGANGPKEG